MTDCPNCAAPLHADFLPQTVGSCLSCFCGAWAPNPNPAYPFYQPPERGWFLPTDKPWETKPE